MREPLGDFVDRVSDPFGLSGDRGSDQRILLLNQPYDFDRGTPIDVESRFQPGLAHDVGNDIIRFMIDRDGLQVAYLGVALAHYLDLESGDIVDLPLDAPPPGAASRFRRVPTRTPESELEDRQLFIEKTDFSLTRDQLAGVVDDPAAFRRVLSTDRRIERAFFNFKNDRATGAIEAWLADEGIE